ncbi:branched-chain amino acid ABC transporter substrate-binding protein [Rhodoferax sp.]|uniref:branched-chain amino acid ABC transporter substrate-binding protein n=1 Tax=Rhodoferax sp. TaxID=50421 RepID=UPI0025FCC8F0|nr:branched-chain amino acid ABC transporter substrate-binding protein [Rhodoferax sp.]MCM2295040.1 branched-chain amino acid ABC transporter substrate-binding protein [Rhodoferax sp.]MDD3934803.1 branched-chain amino acid ABC transporter substrate-binding protein [Rhodoferax sp.]
MKLTSTLLPLMGALTLAFASQAYAQEQTVVIGLTGPLSGSNAFAGKDNENGVRLAVDDLNSKKITVGGKTLKFVLQSEDDQCDPKAGVQVAQKFVDGGVKFVMGPYCSGVAVPASRIYNEGGAMMSTVGTNPKVTLGGYKNLFRIIASDNQIGTGMASYAANVLKVKSVAVIDDRTAFGQGVAQEFTKEAKRLGLNVVGQEFTTDKATDFTSILTTLKAKNPDAIFFGGYAPQAAPMTRQMKQLAVKAKLLGGDTLCSPEMGKLAGDAVNDVVFCAQGGSILEKTAAGPAFKAKYKQRYNQDADVYAAPFYDQTMFIGESIQKAGSLDPDKVGAVIYKGSYKGIMGTYAYDDKGNMKQAPITVYTFKNATLVPLASY